MYMVKLYTITLYIFLISLHLVSDNNICSSKHFRFLLSSEIDFHDLSYALKLIFLILEILISTMSPVTNYQ